MNSHSLQAPAAECSERSTCSDGVQSDTSNGTPTAKRSLRKGLKTAFCTMRQSSGTFENLSAADAPTAIAEWLMSLPQDSRANRSASPENAEAPTTNATCGPQQSNASAWYDRDSRCWKTCQDSLLLDTSEPSSAILPKAGMTVGGVCYPQPKWERRISAIDCGLWPTPRAYKHSGKDREDFGQSLHNAVHLWPTPMTLNRALPDAAAMWPTPNTQGYRSDGELRLLASACVNADEFEGMSKRACLSKKQKAWPTPTTRDHKDGTNVAGVPVNALLGRAVGPTKTTGSLDPTWVEWLMGWPLYWTDLEPICMEQFNEWKRSQTSPACVRDGALRNLWWNEDPATTPQGSEPGKQLAREHTDSLPEMPYKRACDSGRLGQGECSEGQLRCLRCGISAKAKPRSEAMWQSNLCERTRSQVCRVSMGVKNRVARLKATGNGQVSLCAATAWCLLAEDI